MSEFEKASKGAKMDFSQDMSYGDYLGLDPILSAQHPLSDAHDEMLFIVQHQTSELWMRLAIHELEAAREAMLMGELPKAFKMLTRVARIFEQLNSAWDVLRTMTPSEYTAFRPSLGNSSGFQSHQYRLVEFILGNRNSALMKLHKHRAEAYSRLEGELGRASLYQVAISMLCARFEQEDLAGPSGQSDWQADPRIQDLWQRVYEDPSAHWELYELAEKLVDLEDYFRRWRFNHVTTVERIIGFKKGTGGTAGVSYLRKMLEVELFPELWNVRGAL
ncbi:tryptophan 2,3-dioxygenase [Sulfitobacter donghicola]|uniref:Tryptophan 2,3-dioxygenase n=1 Tax=Sulfitobacter donghicola DSW-25 = KCTC 12864 = JCM 14565 TaxID=1300350 RepID=A0A073IKY0_9RHOB|nr:tryptophan 2,3-dioxygenase family protein [Sulfitobacter donghicola]KEJ90156.1 tryptophan 2,3-dioxygenase [Sulfitobacter donghicola DSW-25 = KCTC 12864 = JCM 14565]KIN66686.1 Tryptophan 2,3-dioxygenase [Sulfitobacter donghicola DSW-25 = KCTC 12864 = JCM 14565]